MQELDVKFAAVLIFNVAGRWMTFDLHPLCFSEYTDIH